VCTSVGVYWATSGRTPHGAVGRAQPGHVVQPAAARPDGDLQDVGPTLVEPDLGVQDGAVQSLRSHGGRYRTVYIGHLVLVEHGGGVVHVVVEGCALDGDPVDDRPEVDLVVPHQGLD
jgi:hypothetical protein